MPMHTIWTHMQGKNGGEWIDEELKLIKALFASAKRSEVGGGPRHHIVVQLEDDTTGRRA